jgi:hypothetical protein
MIELSVMDHEGVLHQTIPIHKGGFNNARVLICIVAGFMCNTTALGYNTTVKLKPDGSVDTITVTDPVSRTYCLLKNLHVATGIISTCYSQLGPLVMRKPSCTFPTRNERADGDRFFENAH